MARKPQRPRRMSTRTIALSPREIIASGGNFPIPVYCAWRNCSRAKFYMDVAKGEIRITKHGRRSVVTAADALARQDREASR